MFDNIRADLLTQCGIEKVKPSLINRCRIILASFGFQATVVYRFGRWSDLTFNNRKLMIIRYFLLGIHYCLYRLIVKMYGIDIAYKAIIGKGLYIGHLGGIKIVPCKMGDFCAVHQHVKIGSVNVSESNKPPYIGSQVWIGPHANIAGGVTIGDNSTISAGAIVVKDVSPYHLVAGNPARVICTAYDNRDLLYIYE